MYSVKTLTPLQRAHNLVKLKDSDSSGGFINITETYFDFHRTLYKPELTNLDVRGKVLDDKLMETKYS